MNHVDEFILELLDAFDNIPFILFDAFDFLNDCDHSLDGIIQSLMELLFYLHLTLHVSITNFIQPFRHLFYIIIAPKQSII